MPGQAFPENPFTDRPPSERLLAARDEIQRKLRQVQGAPAASAREGFVTTNPVAESALVWAEVRKAAPALAAAGALTAQSLAGLVLQATMLVRHPSRRARALLALTVAQEAFRMGRGQGEDEARKKAGETDAQRFARMRRQRPAVTPDRVVGVVSHGLGTTVALSHRWGWRRGLLAGLGTAALEVQLMRALRPWQGPLVDALERIHAARGTRQR